MEHRLGSRRSLEQMVRVVIGDKVVGLTKSLNISPGGVCILNPGIGLKRRQIVTLDFDSADFPGQICCRLRSMVIHIKRGVVGLMFEDEFAGRALMAESDSVFAPALRQSPPEGGD